MRVKARACDPLTSKEDINRLREYLRGAGRNGERNALLVTVGINLGLRASDLCKLKVRDLEGDYLDIKEQKTDKRRLIKINQKVREEVSSYVKKRGMSGYRYLFESEKGEYLHPKSLHKIMKEASRKLQLRGNIGSHTLRKTMAYHVMKENASNLEALDELMIMFNHSNIKVTERYVKSSVVIDRLYETINL